MGSTPQSGFYSTPAFELFRRGLGAQTVKRFKGMNRWALKTAISPVTGLTPDWAQDCMNVVVDSNGGLWKFRLPVVLSPAITGVSTGPQWFTDFEQANGTRQIVASFGNSLYWFPADFSAYNLIETASDDAGPWSSVTSNNILFMANGQEMMKWTGSKWQQWGIFQPAQPGVGEPIVVTGTFARTSDVVTYTDGGASFLPGYPAVGDVIEVIAAPDPSYLGTFTVTASDAAAGIIEWDQTAGNLSAASGGELFISSFANQYSIPSNEAIRVNGVTTLGTLALRVLYAIGNWVTVAGVTDTTFDGTYQLTGRTATSITYLQPGLPDSTSGSGTVAYALSPSFGYLWGVSFGNTVTGHESSMSLPTAAATTLVGNQREFIIQVVGPNDPQVNIAYLYRTLDGGGQFFLDQSIPVTTTGGVLTFYDSTPDIELNQLQQAQLNNNPPPVGKFLALWANRVFVFNLNGAASDFIYSGYETILRGRPEESFPPLNRVHADAGADAIAGGGALSTGIVAFSQTSRMYTLTGAVEDVTTTAPVNFSDFFQECPWQIGCSSFLSIQATAYGLVWLAGDLTVNIFDGTDAPQDISMSVYPILRQITAGYANLAVGCQFNWKERDWYCLLFPFAGSTVNNYAIFFSLDKVHNEIEIFPSSIPAQFIGNITTSTLQKVLAIAQGTGRIWNLPVESDTDGGLIQTPPVTPTTSGILPAYWTSGYFGNDQAQRSKSWRAAFIVMDPTIAAIAAIAGPPVPWSANVYLVGDVNDQVRTFQNPQVVAAAIVGNRIPIDYRANRCAIQIVFPPQDMSCSVLELTVDNIATSDRV